MITCRCRLGSAKKIPPNEHKIVFDEFYKLKSHDSQDKHLIHKRSRGESSGELRGLVHPP